MMNEQMLLILLKKSLQFYLKKIIQIIDYQIDYDKIKHVLKYKKDKNEGSMKLNEKQIEKNKDYVTFSIKNNKINTNIEKHY